MAKSKPVVGKSRTVSSRIVTAGQKLPPEIAKQRARQVMLSGLTLPTEPTEPELDIGLYSMLLYGVAGIGKTTAFSGFPDAMFLTTEPGTKGLRRFEFNAESGGCTDWPVVLAAVDILEARPDRFKSVIFDTAEEAYYQCMDYVCTNENIEYPGTDSAGKEDRGRSWRIVRKSFVNTIQRILRTGRAVHYTSHAKEIEIKERGGKKYNKVVPTMTGQARSVIEPLVDFIWFMDYMRSNERADVNRVIFTQGDDFITGKSRPVGEQSHFPRLLPALGVATYELIVAAAKGEDVGLDPGTLLPTARTFKAIGKYMGKAKSEALARQMGRSVRQVKGG